MSINIIKRTIEVPLLLRDLITNMQVKVDLSGDTVGNFSIYTFDIVPGQKDLPEWFTMKQFLTRVVYDEDTQEELVTFSFYRDINALTVFIADFMRDAFKKTEHYWGQEIVPRFALLEDTVDNSPFREKDGGISLTETIIGKGLKKAGIIDKRPERRGLTEPGEEIIDIPLWDFEDDDKESQVSVLIRKIPAEGIEQFHCEIIRDQNPLPSWFLLDCFYIEVAPDENTGGHKVTFTDFEQIKSKRKEIKAFMKSVHFTTDVELLENARKGIDKTEYLFKEKVKL